MRTPSDTPAALVAGLARSDPTRPRLTWYDDQPGPTQGERIELSGRVLANWVAKAANLLQEDLDVEPGSLVAVDLPTHWRAAYWLLAVWSVGAEAVVGPTTRSPDVLVTDRPGLADGPASAVVAVSLPALARVWSGSTPLPALTGSGGAGGGASVIDEARELATYGDQFRPWAGPAGDAPAFSTDSASWSYQELVPAARARAELAGWTAATRVLTSATPAQAVAAWLAPWTVDGSLVLTRGPADQERDSSRAAAERVTDALT